MGMGCSGYCPVILSDVSDLGIPSTHLYVPNRSMKTDSRAIRSVSGAPAWLPTRKGVCMVASWLAWLCCLCASWQRGL